MAKSHPISPQAFSGKLRPPVLPPVLKRPRLLKQLDQARKRPLVWLMGPPGAGKTTLIAQYLQLRNIRSLWYELDAGDGDIATFFHYLGLAALRAAPQYTQPLPHLTPEYRASLTAFTRHFFDELAARLTFPFVIVCDNYHEVPDNSPLHEVLAVAIETVPPGITWFAASRRHPPNTVARLQSQQKLQIMNHDALKLTSQELTQLARLQTKGHRARPSPQLLSHLEDRTGGWMAGALLLLETAQPHLASQHADAGTPEIIFDYLEREVMRGIPEPLQKFLLKTACLPAMTVATAEQLTGQPSAERFLKRLYEARHFTERREHQGRVLYQYHPLFRDFLLRQARETFSPDQLRTLQKAAASLQENTGHIESALELLDTTNDMESLLRVLLQHAPVLFQQGRGQTLLAWLNKLPLPLIEQTPWALFWLGVCTCFSDHHQGQHILNRTFARFETQGDRAGMLSAGCAILESIQASYVNMSLLEPWVNRVQHIITGHSGAIPHDLEIRATFAIFVAEMMRYPKSTTLCRLTGQVETYLQENIESTQRMLAGFYFITYKAWLGHHNEIPALLALLRKPIPPDHLPPLAFILLKTAESTYSMIRADTDRCFAETDQAWQAASRYGLETWASIAIANGIFGALAGDNVARAQAYLDQLRQLPDHLGLCEHTEGWIAFLRGDLYHARRLAESAVKHISDRLGGNSFPAAYNRFALAQVLHAQGQHDEAAFHLVHVMRISIETDSLLLAHMGTLAQASLAFAQGAEYEGLDYLRQAMALGRNGGFVHFPWWHPPLMGRLCAKALEAGIEVEYARHLITTRRLCPDPPPVEVAEWPWAVTIRLLGPFHLVVEGKPVLFSRKAQQRPLELLQALIAFGGQEVAEAALTDILWPEADGDAAHETFSITLHRLRKLIGTESLHFQGGKLSLSRRRCYVDVWAFERLIEQAEAATFSHNRQAAKRLRDKAMRVYGGAFLSESPVPWAERLRGRLRNAFTRAALKTGRELLSSGNPDQVAAWLEACITIDPLVGELPTLLSKCHST